MEFTEEQIGKLAQLTADRLFANQVSPVLTIDQVMSVTGKKSLYAFNTWLKRYAPNAPCGNSRYSKAKIIQGLNKEEKTGAKHRNGKHLKKTKKPVVGTGPPSR